MIERTSISLEPAVMALLRNLAEIEHRDVSNMVARLVLDEAARRRMNRVRKKLRSF